jgi:methyltransferase
VTSAILLLGAVTTERCAELWWDRRNTRILLTKGAREYAPGHYPAIVLLHAFWLAVLWVFAWTRPVNGFWFAVFLVLQALRAWILVTLGRRWTTRILVLPDVPLVTRGPYRFLLHPNYLVVFAEIAVLPLCFDLYWVALFFASINAFVLRFRIRAEETALMPARNVPRV